MSRFGGDSRPYGGYDRGGGGGERWDPERFGRERERAERSRGPALVERDIYEERDIFQPRPGRGSARRESSADGFYHGGGGGRGQASFEEKDIYRHEERFGPPARRARPPPARYYDEEVDSFDESPGRGQMVPFERRRRSINIEKNYTPPPRRAPPRPTIIRRQSSLDTFDRKPLPRYGAPMREPPETIVIPTRSRRRSPPPRFVERDYEEDIRVAEPDFYGDEDFRGFKEREVSTVRRRRANSEVAEFKEEILEVKEEEPFPRRGKTKMPRKLVNKMAIIELGYPFEEEGETIIILKALAKEHIDEVIRISKEMNERPVREEVRKTYVIESGTPPPPPPEVFERRTEIIINPPEPAEVPRSVREWDVMSGTAGAKSEHGHKSEHGGHKSEHGGHKSEHGGHKSEHGGHKSERGARSHKSHSRARSSSSSSSSSGPSAIEIVRKPSKKSRHRSRSSAGHKTEYVLEEKPESNSMSLMVPSRNKDAHKDERQIKAEIRALEAEKKMLKYEREIEKEHRKAEKYKEEPVIIERDRDVVKIEKDRKAPPNPKVIKAMLATLT